MEVKSTTKFVRLSPKKARDVAREIQGLPVSSALDILTLFEEIHETGTTVLFATHDHSLLEARNHRIVYIDEGRAIEARRGLGAWAERKSA